MIKQTNSAEDFNKWRREWLVEKAKTRQKDSFDEGNDYKLTSGFWAWYLEKHKDISKKYNYLYSDITARDCRNINGNKDISTSTELNILNLDRIRQEFIKNDKETIFRIASSLKKIGLEKEAEDFISTNPMEKQTMQTLDRFFDALHEKNFNDLQIIDFYLSLSPEERVSLGCKP